MTPIVLIELSSLFSDVTLDVFSDVMTLPYSGVLHKTQVEMQRQIGKVMRRDVRMKFKVATSVWTGIQTQEKPSPVSKAVFLKKLQFTGVSFRPII